MRFRITVAPEALPGCCFLCRGTSREFFIDIDFQVEYPDRSPFDGAAYLCSECIRELSQMAGYEVPENVTKLKERLSELESINVNLLIQRDGLERAIDGLSAARNAGGIDTLWNSPDVVQMESEGTQSGEAELGDGERTPDESGDDKGMDLLSADAPASLDPFQLKL